MQRPTAQVWCLTGRAMAHLEPVLLVGETGCGKTTVAQLWAHALGRPLRVVSCHQHTETSDLLGSMRPARHGGAGGPLFEWADGPLTAAMRAGEVLLLGEISLAEDAVLERLNAVTGVRCWVSRCAADDDA